MPSSKGGKTSNGKAASGTNTALKEHTDKTRWRLLDEGGRQTWHYLEDDKEAEAWPQSFADKYFLSLPTVRIPSSTARQLLTAYRMLPTYRKRRLPSNQ